MSGKQRAINLVIPTYRPTKVIDTVCAYDEHFHRFGHHIPIIIFDDSPFDQVNANLEQKLRNTHNPVYVVGASEKAAFLDTLTKRVASNQEEADLIARLVRPSFGGNRNNTLLYTAGERFMTIDDDIRPFGIVSRSWNKDEEDVMIRGQATAYDAVEHQLVEKDVAGAFKDILGKRVFQVEGFSIGEFVQDPKSDLYKNKTNDIGTAKTKYELHEAKRMFPFATIKMAETGLTGADDLDTLDFLHFFLKDKRMESLSDPSKIFVLDTYRQFITKENWKTACGVSAYDNSEGLPAFFPTRLRFEDYAYRLWIQKDDLASAHVDAIQYHDRDVHERPNPGKDVLNEEFANYLKDTLRATLTEIKPVSLEFAGEREMTRQDVEKIIELGRNVYSSVVKEASDHDTSQARTEQLSSIALSLMQEFSFFEYEPFRKKMESVIEEEIRMIHATQGIWPRCMEAAFELKRRQKMPMKLVKKGEKMKCG